MARDIRKETALITFAMAGRLGLRATLVFGAVLLLQSCAPSRTETPSWVGKPYSIKGVRYVPSADPNYDRTGIASWYGRGFHGRPTASGTRFNERAMTAAHTTLPFGTRVRVTNLENGRSALLTINDRGPFVGGRIIDVSRGAAARLGFERRGLARVRVQNLARQTGRQAVAPGDPAPSSRPAEGQRAGTSFDSAVARFQEDLGRFGRKLGRLFD